MVNNNIMLMEEVLGMVETHPAIIKSIIRSCKYRTYLELGIRDGEAFRQIEPEVELAMGVDIQPVDFIAPERFFQMTTDEFFRQNTLTFDVIFIDADHSFEQVRIDFENAIKCINANGTIFLHDTDPEFFEYLQPSWCYDSYRMNRYLRESKLFQFVTLPIDNCGLTIVRYKNQNRYLAFTGD